jgi:hypothetical protein
MAQIKVIPWGRIFTDARSSDQAVMLMTEGSYEAADRQAIIDALGLTSADFTTDIFTADAATYTVSAQGLVLADDVAAEGQIDIALPAAATAGSGFTVSVKKIGNAVGGDIVISADGTETIDGGGDTTLTTQHESVTLVCDGSNWHIV